MENAIPVARSQAETKLGYRLAVQLCHDMMWSSAGSVWNSLCHLSCFVFLDAVLVCVWAGEEGKLLLTHAVVLPRVACSALGSVSLDIAMSICLIRALNICPF